MSHVSVIATKSAAELTTRSKKSADFDLTERALTEQRVRGKTLRLRLDMPAEQFTVIRLPLLRDASGLTEQ